MGKLEDENKYYLGNKNLPRPETEFEWTPEMLRDLKKCKGNILYFAENFFYIVNLDRGKEKIALYNCQKKVLRSLRDNRFVCLLSSRQAGKTSLLTIYCLWIACFQDDQNILIVANKEQTAISIFKRVRLAYEMLPNFLKPGVLEYGKTSMTLANGSVIGISTTSSDAGRGMSCSVLILDELGFIDPHLVDQFWKSVFPIISSSKRSKIFVASTPNGTGNLFHTLYTNAESGTNNWKAERVDWWEIPGRDEKWKTDTIKALGSYEAFSQEFGNEFLQTGESLVDAELFDSMKAVCREPFFIFDDGAYLLWEEPKPDRVYVVGVDISEGVGENASVIQILDVTDLTQIKQVAIYCNNKIPPYNFTAKLYEILLQWGSPLAAIERNNCGAQVVDNLYHQHGYTNLIHYAQQSCTNQTSNDSRLGVIAHTNTKYNGVVNMRYWVNELNAVQIYDLPTLKELKTFIRYPNGTWSARRESKNQDDRVMSLIWALIALDTKTAERYFDVVQYDDNGRPQIIKHMDYGVRSVTSPASMYSNEKIGKSSNVLPAVFQDFDTENSDVQELNQMGWMFLNNIDNTNERDY